MTVCLDHAGFQVIFCFVGSAEAAIHHYIVS